MKRFFIALIGGTVLLIGLVLLVLPGPPALFVVSAAFLGFGAFMVPATMAQLVQETLPREIWTPAQSSLAMVLGFSQCIGPVAAAWFAQRAGSLQTAYAILAGALLLAVLLALLQTARTQQQTAAPTQPARPT